MTVLTRPWRALLALFAGRTGDGHDAKWVEPWNAITRAVLHGDPGRFERFALDAVRRAAERPVEVLAMESTVAAPEFVPTAPQPAHDYFAQTDASEQSVSDAPPEPTAPSVESEKTRAA